MMFEKLYKKIDRIASDLKDYIKILSNQDEIQSARPTT